MLLSGKRKTDPWNSLYDFVGRSRAIRKIHDRRINRRREDREWHQDFEDERLSEDPPDDMIADPHLYESERCIFCNSNVYDNMIYGDDGCVPHRLPMVYTTSTSQRKDMYDQGKAA